MVIIATVEPNGGPLQGVKDKEGLSEDTLDGESAPSPNSSTARWSPAEDGGGSPATATGNRLRPAAQGAGPQRARPSHTPVSPRPRLHEEPPPQPSRHASTSPVYTAFKLQPPLPPPPVRVAAQDRRLQDRGGGLKLKGFWMSSS
ncbi:unnamed protein product [Boreogadus saida]